MAPSVPHLRVRLTPISYETIFEAVRNRTPGTAPFTFKAQGGGESATLPGQKPHRKMVPSIETFTSISGIPYAGAQSTDFATAEAWE